MRLERRHGWLLVGLASWNVVIWVTFARNLAEAHSSGEDRPAGYYVAHSVLIVVDLLIGALLGWWGSKVLKNTRSGADPVSPS